LGEVAQVVRGASPRPISNFITDNQNGINWIKIGDVDPARKYITHTAERNNYSRCATIKILEKGDFILSNSMSFGRPYILGIDGCIHDGLDCNE
jgi:type I restriction enzyme S subunit